jgi:hypothetical protein
VGRELGVDRPVRDAAAQLAGAGVVLALYLEGLFATAE